MGRRAPKKAPARRKDRVLAVRIESDVLVIEIGVAALAYAALHSPFVWSMHEQAKPQMTTALPDARYRVTDANAFAEDVKDAMLDELGEDGSTLLNNFLDKATERAIDEGSEHFDEVHP